jgi:catechol 2,3-dioxygenase-like lactoylglutathione lyase family enzyme
MKLDHVALRVADLARAIQFYQEQIGLSLLFQQVDESHHEAFAFLELDGGNLELLQVLDETNAPMPYTPAPPARGYCPHVALGTEDMEDMLTLFEREGIPILKGPLEIPGQVRWIYVLDPDQNILEFVQWLDR